MIILSHPTGTPFSHQAALAFAERDQLHSFITAWFPSRTSLQVISTLPGLKKLGARLGRRRFEPLVGTKIVDDVWSEIPRLLQRLYQPTRGDEIADEANQWLMGATCREMRKGGAQIVYAYEDCASEPFRLAQQMGMKKIYDWPVGYSPAWAKASDELLGRYPEWVIDRNPIAVSSRKMELKEEELELADMVIVPSEFARSTIKPSSHYKVKVVRYGAEIPEVLKERSHESEVANCFRYLFAGTLSFRKGVPTLMEAWQKGGFAQRNCELWLAGAWNLNQQKLHDLPRGVIYKGVLAKGALQQAFDQAHVLVFPSFFDGFGMVITEALAAGLPVITTQNTVGPEILDDTCGKIVEAGDVDALILAMNQYREERTAWLDYSRAAQNRARQYSWGHYRSALAQAVLG